MPNRLHPALDIRHGIPLLRATALAFALIASVQARSAMPLEIPSSLSKKLLGENDFGDFAGGSGSSEMPDNSIDPEHYLVGGGDGFQISIIGLPSQEFFPTINQDGNIYVGDFGLIQLGKVSLTRAKEAIRAHFRKALKGKYEVYVTLIRIKKPVITVSGELQSPGTLQMSGTMRLLDALKLANRGNLPTQEEFDYRQVERRQGDSVRTFDLLRTLANMDLAENPYIYPGDNLMLRRLDQRVIVKGEITGPFEGTLPFKKGETLADLLGYLTFKGSADSSYILIQQSGSDGRAAPARKVSFAEAAGVSLHDRDVITVGIKENYQQTGTVKVSGEAVRPGTFPIIEGKTTAADLIAMIGGSRGTGNLARAYVVKASVFPGAKDAETMTKEEKVFKDNRLPNQRDAALAALRKIRPEENTALNDLGTIGDAMIIDVGKDADAIPLQDGDRLHIPKKAYFVYLSGAVRNPGPYPFREGKPFSYYVELAGGYSSKADRKNEFMLTPYQELAKIKEPGIVVEGDVLVVPNVLEYKTFTSIWVPLLQIIPAIVSVGLSIFLLQNQLSKN